ncbi:TetR/AcrR family transcriptional regulator, partial [Mycobacterium sp. ITM-2017-0098]
AGVAAVIDSERGDRAPEGAPASVVATMLLEFNDRLLERYTLGGRLSRAELLAGAETVWLGTIYAAHEHTGPERKALP